MTIEEANKLLEMIGAPYRIITFGKQMRVSGEWEMAMYHRENDWNTPLDALDLICSRLSEQRSRLDDIESQIQDTLTEHGY